MAMTEGLLRVVRTWVGTASVDADSTVPTDAELNALYDATGSARTVVEETLRQRRADFLVDPVSYTLTGKYTQNAATNIAAIESDLAILARMPDDLGWDEATGQAAPVGLIGVQRLRRVGHRR